MNLKQERIAAGIGFDEAAKELGIGISTLWRYEQNKTKRKDHDLIERMRALYASRKATAS